MQVSRHLGPSSTRKYPGLKPLEIKVRRDGNIARTNKYYWPSEKIYKQERIEKFGIQQEFEDELLCNTFEAKDVAQFALETSSGSK